MTGHVGGLNGEQESLLAHLIHANWSPVLSYSEKDEESECITRLHGFNHPCYDKRELYCVIS